MQSHFQGKGMVQHVIVIYKNKQNKVGKSMSKAEEEEGGAQCADQIMGSMVLELKCKQRMCLQKVQRGCRFQCMAVFGVWCSQGLQRMTEG